MYRKLICSLSFVLMLMFFVGQVGAAEMGMDGYADRVVIRDDGSGNALWYADASDPNGFGDGVVDVIGGAFGLMTDVLMLGDVSGDGIADRVIARVESDNWLWQADYSTSTGFGDGVADASGSFGGLWLIPHAVVDLDGDGIADRVGTRDSDHWYFGDKGPAGGGFGDGLDDWNQGFGDATKTLIGMADLNNDGFADRVLDWWPPGLYWVADLALAGGGFGDGNYDTPAWVGGYGGDGMSAFVGDLNADGYADRAVAMADGLVWEGSLSSPAGFGTAGSDVFQAAGFGTTGDILLLGDVLLHCQPPDGDLSRDCKVDFLDFAIMAGHWLEDTTEYLRVTAFPGWNIYDSLGVGNYRYGPSIIINDNNSIDMWCASPGSGDQWDWIRHKKSTDGGHTWGDETIVLQPTPGSADRCSTCDPGVIKFGDYYYLGYTAITGLVCQPPEDANDNHVFVARSASPTGPYEKWNGSGWGGDPQPFIVYTGESGWGAGEPSFVLKDGTLYIYYTWCGPIICETRVATASASNPNWPGSITYQGVALTRFPGEDSTDVKYIDAKEKFIGIATADRFTAASYIHVWESTDGFTFTPVDEVTINLQQCAHNAGISGTPEGHIDLNDDNFIAYAYSEGCSNPWAFWHTWLNPIAIK